MLINSVRYGRRRNDRVDFENNNDNSQAKAKNYLNDLSKDINLIFR
jgi:hypothetical protein